MPLTKWKASWCYKLVYPSVYSELPSKANIVRLFKLRVPISRTAISVPHRPPVADRGHEALLDAELLVDHLHERREAVRRARRARDHLRDGLSKAP